MLRLIFALLLLPMLAMAQSPPAYVLAPALQALTTTQAAVTVATANTFQSVAAALSTRKACSVQYTGSSIGYVFFGATGSATKAASIQLTPGQGVSCGVSGGVLTDNIAITSATASDTFVVATQ